MAARLQHRGPRGKNGGQTMNFRDGMLPGTVDVLSHTIGERMPAVPKLRVSSSMARTLGISRKDVELCDAGEPVYTFVSSK
jgi:hypothetical protein